MHTQCTIKRPSLDAHNRKGAVVILAALMMVVIVSLTALAIDVGYLCMVRSQAQNCADAAALAAALEMTDNDNLQMNLNDRIQAAVQKAYQCASLQDVNESVNASGDGANSVIESIAFGRLDDPDNPNESVSFVNPTDPNVVLVRVSCTPERGTAVPMFFARFFGFDEGSTSATAMATFSTNQTSGFEKEEDKPCTLMPFVIKEEDWNNFLESGADDNWSYDLETKTVTPGPDGIPELKMYPATESGVTGMITPGNFGTVNIGSDTNNSTDKLRQLIVDGPSTEDMSVYDGIIRLDPVTNTMELTGNATLELNADPGLSAGLKNALDEIVGHPKTIMLYSDVQGTGENTMFTISGFVGIRVVDHHMVGAPNSKYILIQPAMVQDTSAITDSDSDTSVYVGQPVHLIR